MRDSKRFRPLKPADAESPVFALLFLIIFSAWIERLFFDADEGRTWNRLHEITGNVNRNVLYNHLGMEEDGPDPGRSLILDPDCADNPFFLRAYFSWKTGLPFGLFRWRKDEVSGRYRADYFTNRESRPPGFSDVKAFQTFLRLIKDTVYSRTALFESDFPESEL
ncbi:MAG: hypothetical protein MUP70_06710 [Candidatus Aminicenantes bacterium]|nr:hypothetical protein [Candidatus Aminicenantes bacterium]